MGDIQGIAIRVVYGKLSLCQDQDASFPLSLHSQSFGVPVSIIIGATHDISKQRWVAKLSRVVAINAEMLRR